jgi:hypothetical protein
MTIKPLGVASAALILSACAEAYPDLAAFSPPPQSEDTDEVAPILKKAEAMQVTYSTNYKKTARWQDLSQLPIIGGAAAAAWILVGNHDNAVKKAGKVGIGTLAYQGARDQLIAKGMPDAYVAGHGALSCVIAEGWFFSGSSAMERHEGLGRALDRVDALLQETTALRYKEPSPKGDQAAQAALTTARTVADQAITAGRTAQAASLMQDKPSRRRLRHSRMPSRAFRCESPRRGAFVRRSISRASEIR